MANTLFLVRNAEVWMLSPPGRTAKLYIRHSPWFKSTFNFHMHAFSASSNEMVLSIFCAEYFVLERNGEGDTTGRVSRCLKLTAWTVELFVSRVSSISNFLKNLKLPKRKGISNANFRVDSPLARGSPDAVIFKWWDLGRLDRVSPMSGAHRRGLLRGSPSFSTGKSSWIIRTLDNSSTCYNRDLEEFDHSISVMNRGVHCLTRYPDSTATDLTFSPLRSYITVTYNRTRARNVETEEYDSKVGKSLWIYLLPYMESLISDNNSISKLYIQREAYFILWRYQDGYWKGDTEVNSRKMSIFSNMLKSNEDVKLAIFESIKSYLIKDEKSCLNSGYQLISEHQ
uniref:Uncharacterized protein n=1 Tax=Vespula pensylvanica TaxID=30213 RepID=A0A834P716_VESPE|nr:hypothetical protein H0235_004185 [Vespula pensylvanica]